MHKIHYFLLLFIACSFISASPSPVNSSNQYRIRTIVIDAGHGGHDSGTKGAKTQEKDITLQVALKLGSAIQREFKDIKVYYTRTSDVFVKLYERTAMANDKKADLFISIHCNSLPLNSAGRRTVRGTETFVSGFGRRGEQDVAIRENASMLMENNYKENYQGFDPKDPESYIIFSLMKNAYRDQSIRLATFMEGEYQTSGRPSRGIKEQSLAVLATAGMPAILSEIGFLSHPEEERYLSSSSGQEEVTQNILKAIIAYKKQVEG